MENRGKYNEPVESRVELQGMGLNGQQSSSHDMGFTKSYRSGNIRFGSSDRNKQRKYMVVHPSDEPEVIVNAMAKKWKLHPPKLLLCLVGGDPDKTTTDCKEPLQRAFSKEPSQRAFSKVLVEALLPTDGWLFTGGRNCGMIQCVGQALKNVISRAKVSHQEAVAVGVAPLNVLNSQNRRLLRSEKNPVESNMMSQLDEDRGSEVEPNHTHFILVDEDEENEDDKENEDKAKIRDKIVSEIASCHQTKEEIVPTLYLVFGGDSTTIETVHYVVTKRKLPVLIIPSSGGAADVLTDAIMESQRVDTDGCGQMSYVIKLNALIRRRMDIESHTSHRRTKDQIDEIVKRKHDINIYNKEVRIEEQILRALMRATRRIKKKVEVELELAVIWNRLERAKELVTQKKLKNSELHNSAVLSLVNNQTKFVKLFIDEAHFDLKKFLSKQILVELYNEVSTSSVLHKLLSKERAKRSQNNGQFTLNDVGNVLKKLVFDTYESSYLNTPAKEDGSKKNSSGKDDGESTFEDPLRELFVWAVLHHHFSMAKLFWKRRKPSIGGALFASKVLKEMSSLVKSNPRKSSEMYENAKEFQKMAIDILSLCFAEDRRRTSTLLVRKLPNWGHVTCLNLAAAGKNKAFIAQDGVQNLLSELWMGRISRDTGLCKLWFCMCVPLACLFLVTFMSKDDPSVPAKKITKCKAIRNGLEDRTKMRVKHGDGGDQSVGACDETDGENRNCTHRGDDLHCLYKIKLFYAAPVTSFRLNVVAHFLFLGLFSYILLAQFNEEISTPEIVLIFWVFTLFTEELGQLFKQEYLTLFNCFKAWLFGYWNTVDLVSLLMFAIGIGLRFHPVTLDAARIVLALDLIVFYLRILHIFSASKQIGPKLIMIFRMMKDLSTFICILLVFMVSYGVACHAILYPNTEDPLKIVNGVLFRSYFQLYGELFFDELGMAECANREIVGDSELCPKYSWFGTIVLAVYLFLSNILLLNLLIAMLNNTFNRVQNNTDTFWKFQRYQLVEEYYRQPFIIPPFIIVVHIYQVIRWVWDKCCPNKKLYRSANLMKKDLGDEEEIEMSTWEKVKGEHYLAQKKEKANEDYVKRIKLTEEKLNSLSCSMEKYFEGKKLSSALEGRFSGLEDQIASLERLLRNRNKTQEGVVTVDGGDDSCLQVGPSLVRKISQRKNKGGNNHQ